MNIPEMQSKIRKRLLFLRYWCLKLLREILHIATDIPVIGSQCAKNSLKISDQTKAGFFQLNLSRIL